MGKGSWFRWRGLLTQCAVAIVYAIAYTSIHPFSDAHWSLTSGLRFTCLLLIPYRYWLALAVGESIPLIYSTLQCLPQFGYATTAIWSLPPIAIAMPVVWFCRERLGLFPGRCIIDVKAMLICALVTSLVWTLVTYAGLYLEIEPQRSLDNVNPVMLTGFLVGDYVAILTVATWPLLMKLGHDGRPWKAMAFDLIASPLTRDTVLVAIPALALIAMTSHYIGAPANTILQISLFMPVAWLAIKYGWRGAAASGPLAVACVSVLTQSVPDAAVIQTQAFVAFAVTCLFLMGARIAAQIYVEERERHAVRNALRVAQQCIAQSDMRLRQTSHSLELVGGSMSVAQGRVSERAKLFLSNDERQTLTRQSAKTQNHLFRLAETIHPIAWRERGLPAALRETIGRALDETGVRYACDIQGRGLSQLASAVHQSIYRLATEAVTHMSGERQLLQLRLVVRGGMQRNGHRWAVLRIVGEGDAIRDRSGGRPAIASLLGTYGIDIQAMRDQVALFDGVLHVKENGRNFEIAMLLHDAQHMSVGRPLESTSAKLWVR